MKKRILLWSGLIFFPRLRLHISHAGVPKSLSRLSGAAAFSPEFCSISVSALPVLFSHHLILMME